MDEQKEDIDRQISGRADEAKKDILNEITGSQLRFFESDRSSRDVRQQIIELHQIWRDRCISSSESIAEIYLENCKALNINPAKIINVLRKTSNDIIEFVDRYVKGECQSFPLTESGFEEQYISEADGMMRPRLVERITQIVENAKKGFCRYRLIYRHTNPIGRIWQSERNKIIGGLIGTILLLVVTGMGTTIWKYITSFPAIKAVISFFKLGQ